MTHIRAKLRRLLGLGLTALLAASGCGQEESPPTIQGDELDLLLNSISDPSFYESALKTCLTSLGVELPPPTTVTTTTEVDEVLEDSSGIVLHAIETLTAGPASSAPQTMSVELLDALSKPITMFGKVYERGCQQYAQELLDATPSEVARRSLNERYIETVGLRLMADDEWIRIEQEWARCMLDRGFDGLSRPGDQFNQIDERVELANDDLSELQEALLFDQEITAATKQCLVEDGRMGRQQSLRRKYEEEFTVRYRADLETFVLLVSE